jgi:hypothetical protein
VSRSRRRRRPLARSPTTGTPGPAVDISEPIIDSGDCVKTCSTKGLRPANACSGITDCGYRRPKRKPTSRPIAGSCLLAAGVSVAGSAAGHALVVQPGHPREYFRAGRQTATAAVIAAPVTNKSREGRWAVVRLVYATRRRRQLGRHGAGSAGEGRATEVRRNRRFVSGFPPHCGGRRVVRWSVAVLNGGFPIVLAELRRKGLSR